MTKRALGGNNDEDAFASLKELPYGDAYKLARSVTVYHGIELNTTDDIHQDLVRVCRSCGYHSGIEVARAMRRGGMFHSDNVIFDLLLFPRPLTPHMVWRHRAMQFLAIPDNINRAIVLVIERVYPDGGIVRAAVPDGVTDTETPGEVKRMSNISIKNARFDNYTVIANIAYNLTIGDCDYSFTRNEEWGISIDRHVLCASSFCCNDRYSLFGPRTPLICLLSALCTSTDEYHNSLVLYPADMYALITKEMKVSTEHHAREALAPWLYKVVLDMVIGYIDHRG